MLSGKSSVRIGMKVSNRCSIIAFVSLCPSMSAFSALTLLVGRQEGHAACEKLGTTVSSRKLAESIEMPFGLCMVW